MGLNELLTQASGAHGVVTTAQARRCGVSAKQLARLVRDGVLTRPRRGIYRLAGLPDGWLQRTHVALAGAGPGAVASHGTALALHGIDRLAPPAIPHVETASTTLRHVPEAIVHRTRSLPPEDVVRAGGLPCTSGARTCIDLAPTLEPSELIALTDDVIASRTASRAGLHRRASALQAGRPALRTILAITRPGADGEFWSWLERRFDHVVRAAGLPVPQYNVGLPGVSGVIVDALWFDAPLVVELDGLRFHHTSGQRRRDRSRANRISLAGYPLLRYSWHDVVHESPRVVREIARALGLGLAP